MLKTGKIEDFLNKTIKSILKCNQIYNSNPFVEILIDFDYPEEEFFSLYIDKFKRWELTTQENFINTLNEKAENARIPLWFYNREKFIKGEIVQY